jgi:hypothetical protein
LFPALAIPVESKSDFECPDEHLAALREAIPQVDKLLVIGWRAAETHFLELLRQYIQAPIRTCVVAENRATASETANRLRDAGIEGHYVPTDGGFTDLVRKHLTAKFLRNLLA